MRIATNLATFKPAKLFKTVHLDKERTLSSDVERFFTNLAVSTTTKTPVIESDIDKDQSNTLTTNVKDQNSSNAAVDLLMTEKTATSISYAAYTTAGTPFFNDSEEVIHLQKSAATVNPTMVVSKPEPQVTVQVEKINESMNSSTLMIPSDENYTFNAIFDEELRQADTSYLINSIQQIPVVSSAAFGIDEELKRNNDGIFSDTSLTEN
ncbi:unnamed protein product [Enterobius vermicularis]|uniref:Uncharacterized protein n=1 Tax=Enterobius vermicularis TaxID=51028 RepID=A0A0N4VAD4_ENTVE|nr:unnamed protein product [Enterobius vermicularis]